MTSHAQHTQPVTTPADTIDRLTVLCASEEHSPEKLRELVTKFHMTDPDTAALTVRLLSTGSQYAVDAVSLHISSALSVIDDDDNDEDEEFGASLKNDIMLAWYAGNLTEETGTTLHFDESEDNAMGWDDALYRDDDTDRSLDEEYWRGLAILGICAHYSDDENDKANALEFIRWAAKHPDPERIVSVSRERSIVDTTTLRTIMEQQDKVASGLRDGVL